MSSLSFLALFISLLLFANSTIAARKDLGEQWRAIMKDQPMPEAIKGLLHIDDISSFSDEKNNCHDDTPADRSFKIKKEEIFVKDFEPGHGATSYDNDIKPAAQDRNSFLKGDQKSLIATDFEPRPSTTAYTDNIGLKSIANKDFEPRPSTTAYTDDVGLKSIANKDFEPRPSTTAYIE
ncbi:Organ specific protein [Corchorus olitorius]|uniref:Organ specific protein n=1 Tax=Corchorus olitorius TaxID=93759 RepID=A0A1R3K380_9ROSI|nr:Organ specific protein [Corchorus olitorius]